MKRNLVSKISVTNFHTNTLGLARTVCAFGLLLTLLTNSYSVFFPQINNIYISPIFHLQGFWNDINYFILIGFDNEFVSKFIASAILVLVIYGWRPRITCILHWWVTYSFFTSSVAVDGGDHLGAILTLLLIPICLIDTRKNHWNEKTIGSFTNKKKVVNIISFFNILIIQIQAAAIYLHAAIGKLLVDDWVSGTAIYYWVNHSFFSMPSYLRTPMTWFLDKPFIIVVSTWGVIILELVLFSAIFMDNRKKRRLFKAGIIFHIAIIIVHGIFSFFFSVCALLILYLLPLDKDFRYEE